MFKWVTNVVGRGMRWCRFSCNSVIDPVVRWLSAKLSDHMVILCTTKIILVGCYIKKTRNGGKQERIKTNQEVSKECNRSLEESFRMHDINEKALCGKFTVEYFDE